MFLENATKSAKRPQLSNTGGFGEPPAITLKSKRSNESFHHLDSDPNLGQICRCWFTPAFQAVFAVSEVDSPPTFIRGASKGFFENKMWHSLHPVITWTICLHFGVFPGLFTPFSFVPFHYFLRAPSSEIYHVLINWIPPALLVNGTETHNNATVFIYIVLLRTSRSIIQPKNLTSYLWLLLQVNVVWVKEAFPNYCACAFKIYNSQKLKEGSRKTLQTWKEIVTRGEKKQGSCCCVCIVCVCAHE